MTLITSHRRPEEAVYRHVIPAGEPWLFEVKQGQTLRLLDLEGNQAIDTLFYNADNPRERYDAQRTLRPGEQHRPLRPRQALHAQLPG